MDDKRLKVSTEDGTEIQIEVIDIVEGVNFPREYIFYSIVGKNGIAGEDVFASILDEQEESYTIKTIENDEEWEFVNNILEEIQGD